MTGCPRVVLHGEIDLATREQVLALLEEGADQALALGTDLQVDMAAVTFIDSSGLSCLAQAVVKLTPDQRRVRLCGVNLSTLRILELVGMADLVDPG